MSEYGIYGETPDWFTRTIKNIGKGFSDFGNRFIGAYGQSQASRGGFGTGQVMGPELFRDAPPAPTTRAALGGTAGESARFAGMAPGSLGGTPGEERRFRDLRAGYRPGGTVGQELPTEDQQGGGGPAGPSVSSVFAPLFDALDQQRKNAESRYTANAGQIQNIYGQIIGARSADVGDIQEAYSRLQQAAASRGESTLGKMAQREQQRQSQNEAMMQSMWISDIGGATDDVAAQAAQVAQDVETMNQSNWAGMLDVMGKTSEEIARADVTSFGYRQGEDIARLQAAKEDYLQNVADQEFQLKFEEQQAKLAAAQAAAAAQAEAQAQAARDQAKAQEQQYEEFIKYADPLTQIITSSTAANALSQNEVAQVSDAYSQYMSQIFTARPPSGMMQWNAASAAASFGTSPAAEGLSTLQRRLIEQAIRQSF